MAKNSLENFQVIPNGIREATIEAFGIQAKVETRSGVGNDLGLYVDEEREVDQAVRNYIDITSSHLVKLKSHLNTFVTINKLPSEILTHIISFADVSGNRTRHPYMLYTWVCRHWRSTLIQDANLWRLVRFESKDGKMDPFICEFVQRSKLAPLDIVLTSGSDRLLSTFEDLFVSISNRINRAWFSNCRIAPLISGKTFPSLRAVQYNGGYHGFLALIAAIVASEHLDTLHCTMVTQALLVDAREQLASILGRIRNLDIKILEDDPYIMQIAGDLLRNNAKLQNFRLNFNGSYLTNGNNPIIFPKLQFLEIDIEDPSLMEHFRTPELSSVVVDCNRVTESILEVFDFSSIKCLYIIGPLSGCGYPGYSFLVGLKEGVDSQTLSLTKSDDILRYVEDSVNSCFAVKDFLCDPKFPHDCFRLNFWSEEVFISTLLSILPRMTGLTDLYLLAQRSKTFFTKIIALVPSVQKVVIRYHRNLKDYFNPLRDISLCPRLKHISFVTDKPKHSERNFGNSVGKLLTERLRSRQGLPDNKLEYISLEMSPPIPPNWLKRLRDIVATVVVESDSL